MLGNMLGEKSWEDSLGTMKDRVLEILQAVCDGDRTSGILYEQYDYGLMTGLSGIGYSLLYSMDQTLPSIFDGGLEHIR